MIKNQYTILILEDDAKELSTYAEFLRADGFVVIPASTVVEAELAVDSVAGINVVLSDIHLTQAQGSIQPEGLDFINWIHVHHPDLTVVAMSSDPSIQMAEKIKSLGAFLFLRKPFHSADDLAIQIRRAIEVSSLRSPRVTISRSSRFEKLAKKHPEGVILNDYLRRRVRGAALNESKAIVLIGETGTGKEELAQLIHRLECEQRSRPFITVNCANLSSESSISALFGHKKGSFTGAFESSAGAFQLAHGGILFLDEFHRLSLDTQARLLRVLNDGSYTRLGDVKESVSTFQLIAATSVDLEQGMMDGIVLSDLRMRLYGMEIKIPPIRHRIDQMPDFIDWFFAKQTKTLSLSDEERDKLIRRCQGYYWQGNIRQLFGVLGALVQNALIDGTEILADDLPEYRTMFEPGSAYDDPALQKSARKDELQIDGNPAFKALREHLITPGKLDPLMAQIEKEILRAALKTSKTVGEACRILEIGRSTLDAKRRKYGLD